MQRKLVTFCVLSVCLADSSGLEDDATLLGKLRESAKTPDHEENRHHPVTGKGVQENRSSNHGDGEEITPIPEASTENSSFKTSGENSLKEGPVVSFRPKDDNNRGKKLREILRAALDLKAEKNKLGEASKLLYHAEDDQRHQKLRHASLSQTKDGADEGGALSPERTAPIEAKSMTGMEHVKKEENSTEYGRYHEGDMIVEDGRERGSILRTNYWPNGVIPFDFDSHFPQEDRKKVLKVIHYLNHRTCLHFRKHWYFLDGPSYVKITNSKPGCFATVGKPSKGTGKVNLGPSCTKKDGTIIHELLHSVGLFHEHSRYDRDQYVKIHWENINPSDQHNFITRNNFQVPTVPYDYYSIMHYSTHAYSKNGLPTMEPKKSLDIRMMGQRDFLTKWDLAKVTKLYCP